MSFELDGYVDVPARIRQFHADYPEGTLQSEVTVQNIGEKVYIVAKAYAYRTPEDPRPGIGHAAELWPGKTPYTRDSEVMNAETSAWGRAIQALGFDFGKVASADEVKLAKARQEPAQEAPRTYTETPPPDDNPWGDAPLLAEDPDAPHCLHGVMVYRSGEKNGKAWGGYFCPHTEKAEQCAVIWGIK